MHGVTAKLLELRKQRGNQDEEKSLARVEEYVPFIDANDGDSSISYSEDASPELPHVSNEPRLTTAEARIEENYGSSILNKSLQRRKKNLSEDPDGHALLQALAIDDVQEVYKWITSATLGSKRYGMNGVTALIIASAKCCRKIVEALLDAGVKPNEEDWSGRTPLHVASFCGKYESVDALLKRGANPRLKYCNIGSANRAKTLEDEEWYSIQESYLDELGLQIPAIDYEGCTPLHLAALANCLKSLTLLLNAKADPNAKDDRKCTPLVYAGRGLDVRAPHAVIAYEGIVNALIKHGAIVQNARDLESKESSLHRAVEMGSHKALHLLLKNGADPNWCGKYSDGIPPLQIAAHNAVRECFPNPLCVSTLLSFGANLCVINKGESSALETILTKVSRPKKFFYSVLDHQINLTHDISLPNCKVVVNFKSMCPVNCDNQENVLRAILEGEGISRRLRYQIGNHPLLKAFVIHKWSRLKKFFYAYIFVYLVHVLSLSVFVTLTHCDIFHIFGSGWKKSVIESIIPVSMWFLNSSSIVVLINVIGMCCVFPNRYPWSLEMLRNLSGIILCFVVSFSTVYDGDSHVFASRLSNSGSFRMPEEIEDPVVPSNGVFETSNGSTSDIPPQSLGGEDLTIPWVRSPEVQTIIIHFTAVAIFQAWLDLMLLVGRFPWASDALLFTAVLKNVLRVLFTYGFMIVGFAFVFFLEFRRANIFAFGDPWSALLKTMVMMMGEYEYMGIFGEEGGGSTVWVESKLPSLSRLIFLSFVVVASIALMNLMLGLAVSDTQELAEESSERQLMKLAESVVHWECAVHALERLFSRSPKVMSWLLKCRNIPHQIQIPTDLRSSIFPKELMEELAEIALKNRDGAREEGEGQSIKKSESPSPSSRNFEPAAPWGSARTSTQIQGAPDVEANKSELQQLRIEVAELRELIERYFGGEEIRQSIFRRLPHDSTPRISRKKIVLLRRQSTKVKTDVAKSGV